MISLEDKWEIAELLARFTQCSDYGDWAGLAELYTPEIETEMEGIAIRYTGIEGQIEHAKDSDSHAQGKNRHFNFNLTITEEGGEVFANYAFMNVNAGHAAMTAQIVVTGRMRDTVVKTAAGWKIARRFVRFDQSVEITS